MQWWIQGRAPLFLDQTEAWSAKKNSFGDCPLPHLSKGVDNRPPPPPYLKV